MLVLQGGVYIFYRITGVQVCIIILCRLVLGVYFLQDESDAGLKTLVKVVYSTERSRLFSL